MKQIVVRFVILFTFLKTGDCEVYDRGKDATWHNFCFMTKESHRNFFFAAASHKNISNVQVSVFKFQTDFCYPQSKDHLLQHAQTLIMISKLRTEKNQLIEYTVSNTLI